ncbi:transcriptional repressor [Candidatus Kaiserbacteria bacterium]|nr:MAG: transcriptional repressor [Candidatus Kaiserbacteria bacterium]
MTHSLPQLLQEKGFRVTKGRVALLKLLETASQPLSVHDILTEWKGKAPDQATLYRSLADLSDAGIVHRINFHSGTAYFEYAPDRPHHHHIVCSECGVIEEIEECSVGTLQKKLMRESTQFIKINAHILEFFGECKKCVATT